MNGKDRLNGFDFDNHALVDEQVDSITDFQNDSVVHDGKDLLGFNVCSRPFELMPQTSVVWAFEQARAQATVNAVCGTENAVGGSAVDQPWSVSVRVRALRVGFFCEQQASQR
jgi:hypothetical protein